MTRAPNILWICTDQQRWDTLGCYGNEFVKTPSIDRLAKDGMLFERAYSQSPVCTPSRASFLTGRYPRTTRTRQNGQDIPAEERLISRVLADSGYNCGLAGKLHLSTCHPSIAPFTERRIDDGYSEFHWSHHPSPPLQRGKGNNWPANEYDLWLREKGTEYQRAPYEGSPHVHVGPPAEDHQTTWCAQKAITFMEANANLDHSWMFSVNMFDPHHPFDPPLEYLQPYLDKLDEIPLPNYEAGELDNKPTVQKIDHEGAYGGRAGFEYEKMSDRDHRLVKAAYWAMCDLIDAQVGRMLEALERTGQRENTIVIFMSDHGEMLGDHGIYLKGSYFYEEAVHVPLIIAGPGIQIGVRNKDLMELVDIAPTLLGAAGIDREPGMQGRSFLPLLRGEAFKAREDVYCEYYNAMPWHPKDVNPQATMVRTDRLKMVVVHGHDEGELYDLVEDPQERHNLWGDPKREGDKLALYRRLVDRMAWTVDPLPQRRADF
ncbi:arylsulfatase [Devosia pacifica]|uniref:Arylsulfatase n=1 Tax=Devosia pacifica TaxID=1335967 RepID=A0A918S7T5_9HYPH|nr:sulfatase-like hydrolase/transferase [Devosia pacifica]GHA25015.1 arylsulfatase [Devosia pacifica]